MYTGFYGLREKPFSLAPDPRYLFLSASHREALAHLLYGIEEGEGFIEVIGQVGTGSVHVFENDTGPDDSNHNWHGVWAGAGGGLPQKGELDHIAIYDFAPTVLKYFGLEQPADMYGKAAV